MQKLFQLKSSLIQLEFSVTLRRIIFRMNDFDLEKYKIIEEGKAKALYPKNDAVFYNPVQVFNRDLSIAALNTYSQEAKAPIRICEALAASGIRSMRYAHEISNVSEIVANDFDKKAVELIEQNIKLNEVNDKVRSSCNDASHLIYESNKTFDCIDLDPYGSPAPFLDASLRSIKNGGLLLVTATDAAVLCGNGSDTCYTKYGSLSIRTPCCHELGLRILLQCLNSHATRYSRFIVPLISLSIDFYFRLFVLVFDGQGKAKESCANLGYVYICSGCQSYFTQKFGLNEPTKNNTKFVQAHAPSIASNKCPNCDGSFHMLGPVWLGKLHDKEFVGKVIKTIEQNAGYATQERLVGMLKMVNEELDEPFYYVLDDICSVMHCCTPKHEIFRSALLNASHQVSYSHCNKNSIKTNAPSHVIWDVLRCWIKVNPINDKWLNESNRVWHILKNSKLQQGEIDFTLRKDAVPPSKNNKLVRFHEVPAFWGPKPRAKRGAKLNDSHDDLNKMGSTTSQPLPVNNDSLKIYKDYLDDKVQANKVVIFSKTTCGYCDMAKDLFKQIGVKYQSVELDMSQQCPSNDCVSLWKALVTRTGMRTVPQVFINGQRIGGYSELAALNEQGKLRDLLK